MSKRIKAFVLSVLFILVGCCVACNGGSKSEAGKLSIKYFEGGYGSAWLTAAIEAFKAEHPGVEVEAKKDAYLQTSAPSILNSKNPPDIIMTLGFSWQDSVSAGKIESLDDVYETEVSRMNGDKIKIKDFISGDYKSYPWSKASPVSKEEHAWVIPWTATSTSLVYNEALLFKTAKSNGGGYWTAPPATEDELKALVNDINATSAAGGYDGKQVAPFIFPGQAMNWLTFIQTTWWAQYQGVGDESPAGEGNFYDFWDFADQNVYNQSGLIESYRLLQDLFIDTAKKEYKNVPDNYGSKSTTEAEQSFVKGEAVMIPVGSWIENEMVDFLNADTAYPDIKNHMRVMTLPAINGARSTNLNNAQVGDIMLIPSGAKNKELAKDFLRFLHNEEQLVNFTKSNGVMRPFDYDPIELAPDHNWTVFQKDAIAMYTENTNFFQFSKSKSPFFVYKSFSPYQPSMNTIFNDLLSKSPEATAGAAFDYVDQRWDQWKRDLGL